MLKAINFARIPIPCKPKFCWLPTLDFHCPGQSVGQRCGRSDNADHNAAVVIAPRYSRASRSRKVTKKLAWWQMRARRPREPASDGISQRLWHSRLGLERPGVILVPLNPSGLGGGRVHRDISPMDPVKSVLMT